MNYGALLQQTDLRKIYFSVGLGVWIRSPAEGQQNKSHCKGCKSRSFFQPNTMCLTTKPRADVMFSAGNEGPMQIPALSSEAPDNMAIVSGSLLCCQQRACTEWCRTCLLFGFSSHQNYRERRGRQAVLIYALPHPQRNNNNKKKTRAFARCI